MMTWWKRHRPRSPDLFEQELAAALARIAAAPTFGRPYRAARSTAEVWRVLLSKTRNHVYYTVTTDEIRVLTVWGAPKGGAPRI
jgi:plasmid stabilization system protein ParE